MTHFEKLSFCSGGNLEIESKIYLLFQVLRKVGDTVDDTLFEILRKVDDTVFPVSNHFWDSKKGSSRTQKKGPFRTHAKFTKELKLGSKKC